jgi:hypothetical protein
MSSFDSWMKESFRNIEQDQIVSRKGASVLPSDGITSSPGSRRELVPQSVRGQENIIGNQKQITICSKKKENTRTNIPVSNVVPPPEKTQPQNRFKCHK